MSGQYQQLNDEHIIIVPWSPPRNDIWRDILRPVTISLLYQADSSPFFEDNSLVIEGRGFSNVTLVAHVAEVRIGPAKACCVLEDGTGRIYADKDFDSLTHGLGPSMEEEEIAQYRALEHTYVEVLGTPRRDSKSHKTRLKITSINPVHGYHQVMYHALNVIHSAVLTQQHIQPYNSGKDSEPNENEEITVPVGDGQVHQGDVDIQHHTTFSATPVSYAILPNTFSPRRHRPYATLKPLERAIMKYMNHCGNHHVLTAELAQAVQASCGCTEPQFEVAFRMLLSEAYITSPLDDEYVVITPRH